jgi:hypothetical protein
MRRSWMENINFASLSVHNLYCISNWHYELSFFSQIVVIANTVFFLQSFKYNVNYYRDHNSFEMYDYNLRGRHSAFFRFNLHVVPENGGDMFLRNIS